MEISNQILSDITTYMKYAKYLPNEFRRETWNETVTRNKEMHQETYPDLKEEIEEAYKYVYDKKVLPSMRSLQFGGKPIQISPNRVYNCAYAPIDHPDVFGEIMFLLLGGTGVGYSVQNHHIEDLPILRGPLDRKRRFLIGDSIEGWADAIKVLMHSYFYGKSQPVFDFSDIRPKGALLVTSGGKAPGPQPLKDCIHNVRSILESKKVGSKLTSLEAHDIVCHIADAVLAGGIRRAALISLFSIDDESMLTSKFGNWWESNPQRGRANNSALVLRHKITKDKFLKVWDKVEKSGSGEPGVIFSNDKDWGTNPCAEIALRPYQFCNLTELNASTVESQEDLNERARVGAFIGTLQAGYTDFHYLRDVWRRTTEKDALIGVGMTGIASNKCADLNLTEAAEIVKEENKRIAGLLGINAAARTTTVKPSGTSSLVLGVSSGIHGWHNDYYIRRIRVGKNEAIYNYLAQNHPELVEDEFFRPTEQAVIQVPQKAPEGAIYRTESAIKFLERVKRWNTEWVHPGHIDGQNTHNVSATVSVKEDEWEMVGEWMWENRNTFNGLSVLPYFGGSYQQAPFEDTTKEVYEEMFESLKGIDLTKVIEMTDDTDLAGELACIGASCEVV